MAPYRGDFAGRPEASFTPAAAVLPGLTDIEIRDPRTGRMLRDVQVGEEVGGVAVADGVVVAQTRAESENRFAFRMLRAYDLSSGRELWSDTIYGDGGSRRRYGGIR